MNGLEASGALAGIGALFLLIGGIGHIVYIESGDDSPKWVKAMLWVAAVFAAPFIARLLILAVL